VHTPTTMGRTPGGRPAWPRYWRPAVLAWVLWALTMFGFPMVTWLDYLLRRAGRPDLALWRPDVGPQVLALVGAATAGAVLAARRPRHPVGWLLLALGLLLVADGVALGYASYGLLARPGALPAADYVAVYLGRNAIPLAACLGFMLLLTPTGSLPSPRWRWWARIAAAAPLLALVWLTLQPLEDLFQSVANPLAMPGLAGPPPVVAAVTVVATLLPISIGAWSLVVRFRRARGVERQQLRWLALAAALVAVGVLVIAVLAVAGIEALLGWLFGGCVALLPVAAGASILRYRLYDLDRIISRTLAYGLLTILLGSAYAGVVLALGRLLPQGSSLVVAGATLAVAAVFQPARRHVQRAVDRRFNRRRHDAAHTIQAFSGRLREQVDLDTLTAELLTVVEQAMQPTQASLWLRPQPPSGTAGASMARQRT
jgi:hypothetical protein